MTNFHHQLALNETKRSLLPLAILALIVGAFTGLAGVAFQVSLQWTHRFRDAFIHVAHLDGMIGFFIFILACASATAAAVAIVQKYTVLASGSGIPHVEAVLAGLVETPPLILLPVKFIGGVLAIGAGLMLGREGPSVQMGASIAQLISKLCHRSWADCRVLMAAGAGAGLATAFDAPIAGAVFVLEELVQKFEHRIAMMALAASAAAISVAHFLIGDQIEFHISINLMSPPRLLPLYMLFGAATGLLAIAFNHSILRTMTTMTQMNSLAPTQRAALVGAFIGAIAWQAPHLVGAGNILVQQALDNRLPIDQLPLILAVRFAFGALCYSVGAPGGIFAPMLALGSQFGIMFAALSIVAAPQLPIQPTAFALVGMTALFSGASRAPLTGIILVTEMTENTSLLLPMLCACFTAMLTPTILGNPSIYESLRNLILMRAKKS